jgi:tripeptidyl-peptidase-1
MAPADESVQAVKKWLSSNGIQAQTLVGQGDWLGFSTTVSKASELFDAEFWNFRHLDTGKEEIRTLAYSIPAEMKSHIELAHPMISLVLFASYTSGT